MKKITHLFFAFAALIVVSCTKAEIVSYTPEPEMFEVKIGVGGAFSSEMTPYTKSTDDPYVTGIGVWACPENGTTYSPYAYGYFDNGNITVSLKSGYKYKFTAKSALFNGATRDYFCIATYRENTIGVVGIDGVENVFHYGNTVIAEYNPFGQVSTDAFYGETTDYVPSKGGSVSINLERVSFALRVFAQNLSDGVISVNLGGYGNITIDSSYTPEDVLYVLKYYAEGYRNPDHFEEIEVDATLTRADNVTVPLGAARIKVMKNQLTKLSINAAVPSSDNTFALTYSNSPVVENDEMNFEISAEETVDTPVN